MVEFLGRDNDLLLFANGSRSVIVDESVNLVAQTGFTDVFLETHAWTEGEFSEHAAELADAALSTLDVSITASAGRLYTVPKSVKTEAERALAWHEEYHRGGTPVALAVARELASGKQVSLDKIRQIALFFPRHAEFAMGGGWTPADNGFPSAPRVTWGLWGGNAADRWTMQIVHQENSKALTADGFSLPGYDTEDPAIGPDLDAFQDALELTGEQGPEFIARVCMDGSGLDRLYKVDLDGRAYVWDDMNWSSLGTVGGDIWTFDRSLDDPYGTVDHSHIVIDPDSAVILAAHFTENPFEPVSIEDIDKGESQLALEGLDDLDYELVDSTIVAATPPPTSPADYTPQERSQNASKQQRDANGKFAKVGGRVIVNNDPHATGTITNIDHSTGLATVAMESGQPPMTVPVKQTAGVDKFTQTVPNNPIKPDKVDVTGILAEPRTPINMPQAQLPGTLPSMTSGELHQMLYDWPSYVKAQRQAPGDMPAAPPMQKINKNLLDIGPAGRAAQKAIGEPIYTDPYKHPLLKSWLKQKGNQIYAFAVVEDTPVSEIKPESSTTQDGGAEMTPPTSDVQPVYLAVVAPDDPTAVMQLISVVPASSTSTEPMTYTRKNGAWTRDPQMINQLKSATPPPVVPLDAPTLDDVITQVDETQNGAQDDAAAPTGQPAPAGAAPAASPQPTTASLSYDQILTVLYGPRKDIEAIIAAGGFDRNRGNAEKLRRYWVHGEGAAKIRWGEGGDWKRCVMHLGKFMGERAKGYCELRHQDALHETTSEHAKQEHSTIEFATSVSDEYKSVPVADIVPEEGDEFDAEWVPDAEIVEILQDVDGLDAVTAAGGLDRNRGGAEKLRRYWTVGEGGAKIAWGSKGDWTRCVRHLEKYLGPRAKGYCALRHKEMTGMWTGDKRNRQFAYRVGEEQVYSDVLIQPSESVVASAFVRAKSREAKAKFAALTAAGPAAPARDARPGARFKIPLVIPEEVESGDGRIFKRQAIDMRDLPLPLLWQQESADGHSGSVVVGRIDKMERVEQGIGNASGIFDNGEYGAEAERLVRNGFLRGVSADMDKFEAKPEVRPEAKEAAEAGDDAKEKIEDMLANNRLVISKARIMAVTIVPKPAFQECSINLDEGNEPQEDNVIPDGIYVDDVDPMEASALVAAGYVASAVPLAPPTEWFQNPQFSQATPLTVGDDGRVYGHIAAWHQDHIGMAFGTRPPRSRSNYAFFHSGVVRTEEGADVPVGQLTLAGGHASIEASAVDAIKHYDDTASAIADVHAGEDEFGIWVAGSVRPGATPEQIRALRASAPSGDWRPIKGNLELVAVCQVNVPGFPIARARVASGQVYALVAAGAAVLAKMKSDPLTEMQARIANLEQVRVQELNAKAMEAKARIDEFRTQKNLELAAKAEALSARMESMTISDSDAEFGFIPKKKRDELAKKGHALEDGSFPIATVDDLRRAVRAYGRASADKKAAARTHIMKRARGLHRTDLIPDSWKTAASEELTFKVEDLRSRINDRALTAGLPNGVVKKTGPKAPGKGLTPGDITAIRNDDPSSIHVPEGKYTPKTQPRDDNGKFRLILARLKSNIGDKGNQTLLDQIKTVENLTSTGDYKKATISAADLANTLDRVQTGTLDAHTKSTLRQAGVQLSKTIANMPLPFDDQAQKIRYSDLPPALQDMTKNLIDKVMTKLGPEKGAAAAKDMQDFISGFGMRSQSEVSSLLNGLLGHLD